MKHRKQTGTPEQGGLKIDFIIVGAQKSGTRALRHFLEQHPDIEFSEGPEPHFFDAPDFPADPDYAQYHSQFPQIGGNCTVGEVTPSYIFWGPALNRIRAYHPGVKLIAVLRNPVERAYSQWAMQITRGDECRPFEVALLCEPFRRLRHGQTLAYTYLERGFYSRQLQRMFRLFPHDQCLVLRTDDLRGNHAQTLRLVCRFLGVASEHTPTPETIHSRTYRPMRRLTRWALTALYRREVRRLERLLGWDCSDWL